MLMISEPLTLISPVSMIRFRLIDRQGPGPGAAATMIRGVSIYFDYFDAFFIDADTGFLGLLRR